MKTPATKSAARAARDSSNECGHDRLTTRMQLSGRINFLRTKKNRTPSMRGCGSGREAFDAKIGGVDSVHTLGFGLVRTSAGLGRIPHVWAGVQCLQGLEPGSSPTSGTVFPQVRGHIEFCRVHIVHTLASDLMFRVCGVPD